MPELIARAFAVAQSGRPGPVVVALPEDVLDIPTASVAGPRVRIPRPAPPAEAIAEAVRMLAAARAPLILAGGGGWSDAGRAALRGFAEAADLPVLTAWRFHDLIDNDSPSFVGQAGLGKPPYMKALIAGADLILALGVRFGEITTDGYTLIDVPDARQALIHAHASDAELNKIHTADLPIHAHPELVLAALTAAGLTPAPRLGRAHRRARAPTGSPSSRRRRSRAISTWAR